VIQSHAAGRALTSTNEAGYTEYLYATVHLNRARSSARVVQRKIRRPGANHVHRAIASQLDRFPTFLAHPHQTVEGVAEMTLRVVSEGLATACAGLEALTARLAAAHAGAAPLITAVVPPAIDPVSLQSAAEFSARGGLHAAVATQCTAVLGRAGIGVGDSGVSYASGDAAGSSLYLFPTG
jgi:hypothetical protein